MLIFILIWFVLVPESYQTTEKLRKGALLNQMREWGTRTFESKLYNTGAVKNQFLVAAIITPTILNDVTELHLIDECPLQPETINEQMFKDTSLICARSAVIFNRVDEEVWKRSRWHDQEVYKYHSWHGEYLFLHEGILPQLQKNAEPNVPCEIILYSYFIPCNYRSDKQPYRCADLLSHYDNSNDRCKISTIGYTRAHPATAKDHGLEEALKKLRNKGYDVIKLAKASKDPGTVLIDSTITSIASSSPYTFQDVFYSCLRHTPIVQCCIDLRDESNSDRIVSYYTNYITRNAVKNSNGGGRLLRTKAQKERMELKFQLEIPISLGKDCPRCLGEISKRRMSLYVNTCAKKAFDMTDFFGKTDGPKLMTHEWKKYGDKWTNLYRLIPDSFWDESSMNCLFGMSVPSLCTINDSKRKRPGSDVPSDDGKRPKSEMQSSDDGPSLANTIYLLSYLLL